ncbi:phage terminase large subunit family protein [Leptothoe sp. EHU-05/26/07-4]
MLTKRQLIEKLIALPVPDDTPVVTEGFDETNYTSISDPSLRSNLLGSQSTGLAAAILGAAAELSTSDRAKREAFLKEKWTQGGKPFVERVRKYGKTEEGDPIEWTPWFEELLEAEGDARLSDLSVQACSQLGKTFSFILLACDIQTTGRLVFGMVYDKKEARTKFAATQFRPIMDHWLDSMKAADGIDFDRSKDTVNASRKMLGGVNSIFSFASTADQSQREGKSAVSSELAGWSGDWLLEEERSQWPLGAVDVAYRRLDNSAIATKPVRSWGTPGAGLGVEKEVRAADYHFYPHGQCEECGEFYPVDAFGSLLKPFERENQYGQKVTAYVSESNRPVEWFHHDPEDPIGSAYFACPHCEVELTERSRTQARFKDLHSGIWLRDFLDQLPKEIPSKRYRVALHYGPLLRASKINLAADLIRNGLEMANAADWVQQGLGHSTEPGATALTLAILERAIAAPPASRFPEVRLAGIDQGRSGYHTLIKDVSLPLGWESMPVAQVMEKAVRTVLFSGEVSKHHLQGKLREFQVQYGGIDNEPDRTFAGDIQRATTLAMMDQRTGLGDAYKKSFVEDSGKIPCILIRNEKFLRHVMNNFFLVADDGHPLTRLPDDWTRWISSPTERSPLRHYMGVKCDPDSGKWEKADQNANGLYYADMFSEAALYVWLSQGGEGGDSEGGGSGGYVPGGLVSVMGRGGGGSAGLGGYQPRGGAVGGRSSRRRGVRSQGRRFGRKG